MGAPDIFTDYKLLRSEQSAFGTIIADASAFTFLEVDRSTLPIAANVIVGNSASGSRYKDELHVAANTNMLAPEFNIGGVADLQELSHQIYSFMQNISNTAGALTFTLASTQPDFAADAGYFATYALKTGTASTHRKIKDVITKELTLSIAPSEYLKFSAGLIGRGATVRTGNISGTITRNTPTYLHYGDIAAITLDFTGSPVSVQLTGGFELKFTQDIIPYGIDTGEFYSYAIANRSATFTANIIWDANALSCESDFVAGNFADLQIGWGTDGSVSGDLYIDMHGYFTKCEMLTDDLATMSIEMVMVGRETATAIAPITIAMNDGNAHAGW